MKVLKITAILLLASTLFTSCVSKKKFTALQGEQEKLTAKYNALDGSLNKCELENNDLRAKIEEQNTQIGTIQDEVDFLKKNQNNLINSMSDLAILSKIGAESMRKSLEIMNDQSRYIKDLNQESARKDSINLTLVTNLKRSLSDVNDKDVSVEVRGGVVFVSISDKMLFKSGSHEINSSANKVLAKIATIIKDHKDLNVMVEGHTDDMPIHTDCVADNWDLSVKRATSVVRFLETNHKINPGRLTAAGRGDNDPKEDNKSNAGRSKNRRTEIVLTPRLDQFMELAIPNK
jgi:chemotaxis protein MotB